jgi:hypothetical protein
VECPIRAVEVDGGVAVAYFGVEVRNFGALLSLRVS